MPKNNLCKLMILSMFFLLSSTTVKAQLPVFDPTTFSEQLAAFMSKAQQQVSTAQSYVTQTKELFSLGDGLSSLSMIKDAKEIAAKAKEEAEIQKERLEEIKKMRKKLENAKQLAETKAQLMTDFAKGDTSALKGIASDKISGITGGVTGKLSNATGGLTDELGLDDKLNAKTEELLNPTEDEENTEDLVSEENELLEQNEQYQVSGEQINPEVEAPAQMAEPAGRRPFGKKTTAVSGQAGAVKADAVKNSAAQAGTMKAGAVKDGALKANGAKVGAVSAAGVAQTSAANAVKAGSAGAVKAGAADAVKAGSVNNKIESKAVSTGQAKSAQPAKTPNANRKAFKKVSFVMTQSMSFAQESGATDKGKFVLSDAVAEECDMSYDKVSEAKARKCIEKYALGMNDSNAITAAEWKKKYDETLLDHVVADYGMALSQKTYSASFEDDVSADLSSKSQALSDERQTLSMIAEVGKTNQEIMIRMMEATAAQLVTDSWGKLPLITKEYFDGGEK